MLPLAERMVKKFIDEGKIEAEQEIQLFLMILEMQVTIFFKLVKYTRYIQQTKIHNDRLFLFKCYEVN